MLCWIFLKKWFKKPNIIVARQTLNNLGVAISRHITFFPFLPISGHFWTTQKNQSWSIRSRKVNYNWGHFFFDYLKRKSFYSRLKKKYLFRFNCWWADISSYIYSTSLVITKMHIFILLYFNSVLLLIMRSQPASMSWSLIFEATFYHCWSFTEHSVLWIRCVVYIWW